VCSSGPGELREDIAVKGEIVDSAYLAKGKKGPITRAAPRCAPRAACRWVPTESNELYLLIDDHANPKGYEAAKKLAGTNAEINGKKYIKDGMASIVVNSASGL
jgi:hypothetical protein